MIKEDTPSCGDGDPAAARSMFCSFIKVLDERVISETLESSREAVPKRSRTGELPSVVSATCAAAGRRKRSRFSKHEKQEVRKCEDIPDKLEFF